MNVPSFNIDHDRLDPGLYVSRKDYVGEHCITSFDIRLKKPNVEPPLDMPGIHSMEHLLAVYLRGPESGVSDDVIYVGPMGCRTGMYLVLKGELKSSDIAELMKKTFKYIVDFSGTVVPASTSIECGNYLEHNLTLAKYYAKEYYDNVLCNLNEATLNYPE